ncbi:MAG: hypothetical protein ACTSUE_07765 [Promethearchaeota archaeon]
MNQKLSTDAIEYLAQNMLNVHYCKDNNRRPFSWKSKKGKGTIQLGYSRKGELSGGSTSIENTVQYIHDRLRKLYEKLQTSKTFALKHELKMVKYTITNTITTVRLSHNVCLPWVEKMLPKPCITSERQGDPHVNYFPIGIKKERKYPFIRFFGGSAIIIGAAQTEEMIHFLIDKLQPLIQRCCLVPVEKTLTLYPKVDVTYETGCEPHTKHLKTITQLDIDLNADDLDL